MRNISVAARRVRSTIQIPRDEIEAVRKALGKTEKTIGMKKGRCAAFSIRWMASRSEREMKKIYAQVIEKGYENEK